jgi:hypothetical protein
VPTDYFVLVLGPHLKYSSCLYNSSRNTLAEAEHNMLGETHAGRSSTVIMPDQPAAAVCCFGAALRRSGCWQHALTCG